MHLLVVAHDASRSGSPRVLAALLRRWRRRADARVDVVLLRDGPLRGELEPVHVLAPADGRSRLERLGHGLRQLGWDRRAGAVDGLRWRRAFAGLDRPDVVLLSSAPAAAALQHLPWPGVPVAAHVHELDGVLADLDAPVRAALLGQVDRYVAASRAVRTMLVERLGVDAGRVVCRHEPLDPDRPPLLAEDHEPDPAATLGIAEGAPVVLAAGARRRRKGLDLFVQVAVALRSRRGSEAPHLVWVGPVDPDAQLWPAEHDVRAAGLEGRLHLVPEVEDLGPWLRRAHVFALPSREDPYPLVCLEAGWWGTPFVAFDCGGIGELAGGDGAAGTVVPALDVEAMADALLAVLDDPERAATIAAEARRRIDDGHLADDVAGSIWDDLCPLVAR